MLGSVVATMSELAVTRRRKTFGGRVRDLRRAMGWTQTDLADRLEKSADGAWTVTQKAVSSWEVGRVAPEPYKIETIEEVLGEQRGALTAILFGPEERGDHASRGIVLPAELIADLRRVVTALEAALGLPAERRPTAGDR